MSKNFIAKNTEVLQVSKSVNPEASFNKPKFTPSSSKSKYVNESVSFNELPKVILPKISTIIKTKVFIPEIKYNENVKIANIQSDKSVEFVIDRTRDSVIFSNGKEFFLDSLTDINSKKGYSIDKNTAMEIANDYLKLNIPSKNKKSIFIKAIREKLGLLPE
jgi:hypothetical protein